MKILFLVPGMGSGGAERTVSYLSSYLAKQGHEVRILSLVDSLFYELDSKVRFEALQISTGSQNPIVRFWLAVQRFRKIQAYVKKYHPDVVFCMLAIMAKYVLRLHKTCGFKLITSERNDPVFVDNKQEEMLKEKIFLQSDGVVFQTQRAKQFYSEDIQEKGVVIHNAVGNPLAYQMQEVSKRKNKISAIGRLSWQKDYDTMLKAFSLVLKRHPELTLEIYGEGADRARLEALIATNELSEKVILKGACCDALTQAADSLCYVLSSRHEGMPNTLLEAMAAGLPCVSTDCPNGPAELIQSGENGLLVPVGDAEKLSEAILTMVEDRNFAEACGKRAKDILRTHSIEKIANEYMNFIQSIYEG